MNDLLYVLVGVEGTFIKAMFTKNPKGGQPSLSFEVAHLIVLFHNF